jgi:hypothetical protein
MNEGLKPRLHCERRGFVFINGQQLDQTPWYSDIRKAGNEDIAFLFVPVDKLFE